MLLALDTATTTTVLALADGARLLVASSAQAPGRHEATLLPGLETLLAQAGVGKRAITAIGVGLGPGAYTSLRVGLATAKGLSFALRAPLVGVGTLRALARSAVLRGPSPGLAPHTLVAVLADARRGELYGALYGVAAEGSTELLAPVVGAPRAVLDELAQVAADRAVHVVGGALGAQRALLTEHAPAWTLDDADHEAPLPEALAHEAREALARGEADVHGVLEPLYVRPLDAALPAVPLRLDL